MYYLSQFASIFVAGKYSIPAVLHSYRIFWPLYTYSSLYSRQALIVIFGIGPLVCLSMAFGLFHLYNRIKTGNRYLKIFLIWLIFHGVNQFFGAYISGVITRTGFVYTTEWLFYSRIFGIQEILLVIVSVLVLVGFGLYSTKQFILAANANQLIDPAIRQVFILAQVFLPWLVGYLIIFLSNLPHNPPELLLLYLASFLMILPVFFNFNSSSNRYIKLQFQEKKLKVNIINLLVFTASLVLIRLFIYPGISFS
jgi:hypothetical protein